MANNNFSIEKARGILATKTGIPVFEFIYAGVSKSENFIRYKFYRGDDRTILYTVLSEEEVNDLDETCPNDFAP